MKSVKVAHRRSSSEAFLNVCAVCGRRSGKRVLIRFRALSSPVSSKCLRTFRLRKRPGHHPGPGPLNSGRRSGRCATVLQTIAGLVAGLAAAQGQKRKQKGSGEKSYNHIGHSHAPQMAGVGRRGASTCFSGNELLALVLIVTIFCFAAIAPSVQAPDLSGGLRSAGAFVSHRPRSNEACRQGRCRRDKTSRHRNPAFQQSRLR